jgi:hypothetical protein
VNESIVATVEELPDHTPPVVAQEYVPAAPTQSADGPEIAAGKGLTVTSFVTKQLVLVALYVIVAVPAAIPVTAPDVLLTLAIVVSLLLQVPAPPIVLEYTVNEP